jgi:SAM-dependent methyltransferase
MKQVLEPVARYYTDKLREFGAEPRGVDWNGEEGQRVRFAQLCKVVDSGAPFSIADIGCGYGALYDYLAANREDFQYLGVDISASMLEAARSRYGSAANARFLLGTEPDKVVDYAVASGIFNVKLKSVEPAWLAYIEGTIEAMDRVARRGFAFNCLTSWSDEDRKRADLHYADPAAMFNLCKRKYSRNVALLHDYDLYEFTIVVRK